MTKQVETGEWQINEHGKRYRRVGNTIEYEQEFWMGGVFVPESKLDEFLEARRAADELRKQEEQRRLEEERKRPKYFCPFQSGIRDICEGNSCAFYHDNACALSRINRTPEYDSIGRRCPISKCSSKCRNDCALYRDGCLLTAVRIINKGE